MNMSGLNGANMRARANPASNAAEHTILLFEVGSNTPQICALAAVRGGNINDKMVVNEFATQTSTVK
jgi:hypothetical protein